MTGKTFPNVIQIYSYSSEYSNGQTIVDELIFHWKSTTWKRKEFPHDLESLASNTGSDQERVSLLESDAGQSCEGADRLSLDRQTGRQTRGQTDRQTDGRYSKDRGVSQVWRLGMFVLNGVPRTDGT